MSNKSCWYLLTHFDGPYVTGFLAPVAENSQDAIKQVKKALIGSYKLKRALASLPRNRSDQGYAKREADRVRSFLRGFKRPWRKHGKNSKRDGYADPTTTLVIKCIELKDPVTAGYWLDDTFLDKHLCNMVSD